MNSKTYSKKKSSFFSTVTTNFVDDDEDYDDKLQQRKSEKRKVHDQFEFDEEDDDDKECVQPKKQSFQVGRSIVDSEEDEDLVREPLLVVDEDDEEQDDINVRIKRKLRKRSDKNRAEKKSSLHGYSKDGFIASDGEESEYFDPDDPEKVTPDILSPEEREEVNVQIIQDAYKNDATQTHTRRSIQEKRESFTQAAVVKHVTLSTTADMKDVIMTLFSGQGNIDLFISKFDKLLLNDTFASFKRPHHRLTINAALSQKAWKSRERQSRKSALCFLCGVQRRCRDEIVNHRDRVLGYVGSECIDRWILLQKVYRLRFAILSTYGQNQTEELANEIVRRIDDLKQESLRTLQIMTNKFLPEDERIDEDAVDDE